SVRRVGVIPIPRYRIAKHRKKPSGGVRGDGGPVISSLDNKRVAVYTDDLILLSILNAKTSRPAASRRGEHDVANANTSVVPSIVSRRRKAWRDGEIARHSHCRANIASHIQWVTLPYG